MSHLVVKAVDTKGHWALGRYWPHAPVQLEIVDGDESEKPSAGDSPDIGSRKQQMRADRLMTGKATAYEAEFIRSYPHLVEVHAEKCGKCEELQARVHQLEDELKKAKK